jgi:LuxR family maltose regulon positive regulatory protein
MYGSLLATKLRIPEHPHGVVARARLTQFLEVEVVRHRLTVVSAPAGYGKTTLLAHWARATAAPAAWLSLSAEDNDPDRLMRYLLAAWERIRASVVAGRLGLLLGSQNPNPEAVLSAFLNAAAELEADEVIVLDDYHLIEEAAVHEGLAYLLDHLPPRLHFVIGTRAEPPLPIARYRARGQLLELSAEDLRFSLDEAADFLQGPMRVELPREAVERLQAQLEGWAAGLQLAALSLRHQEPAARRLAQISGRQPFVADYLSQDVVDRLPAAVRDFLLRTSILDRLCASLCEVVTGAPGGQAMLEYLERQNLFVQAVDDERRWFRYHPLFADFLRGELGRRQPADVAELHRRAAAWYAAHDLPEPAFEHAIAGDHPERVIEVFDRYFNAKLNGGELRVVQRWVDSLPAAWYATYPVLGLMRAGWLAYTGDFEACVRLVDEIEERLAAADSESARSQLARVMAVRCLIACVSNDVARAETYAGQALRNLPREDVSFRPGIFGALGDAYRRNGRWEEAKDCYLKALEFTDAPAVRLFSPHVFGALADLELRRGRLQNASGYWKKALTAIQEPENWGRLELPLIGWVYIRMGELLYEWNQLAEAWEHLSRGLERVELGGDVRAMIAGYLAAGRLKLTKGDVEAADGYLERARPLVEQAQFPEWSARFDRLQLELWLAQDRLRGAVDWADQMLARGFEGQPETEAAQLAVARVLIAKGDTPSGDQALALLARLLKSAEAEGRTGVVIEALALQALARQAQGRQPEALVLLERALRLAEPEGYLRIFADLGLPFGRLLQAARARAVMPDYVERLLAAFGPGATAPPGAAALPEPLTEREMEVLRLLAAGLTYREIAERLVVSPETVKKHSGNIYGKLGAGNRTQAVARARELDLLA